MINEDVTRELRQEDQKYRTIEALNDRKILNKVKGKNKQEVDMKVKFFTNWTILNVELIP